MEDPGTPTIGSSSSSAPATPPPPPPARRKKSLVVKALDELGLVTLYNASRDVKLLCLQRFARLFAYGGSTLVLVAYLEALGNTKTGIGLFMTLTMAGDVCISFLLTLFADALGRQAILALGAGLMVVSGVVFALAGTYWVLLLAAIVGVISPSGNEIGPFRAVEESIVAHLTSPQHRGEIYAWYILLGYAGSAVGIASCGGVVQHLTQGRHWDEISAYRVVYLGYAVLGVVKLVLSLLLTRSVESEKKQQQLAAENNGETAPLLNDGRRPEDGEAAPPKRGLRALLPDIHKDSIAIVINLCMLFAVDSFASGLASLSWLTYFIRSKFHVEEGELGSIFFVSQMLAAVSTIVASSLAKRFGNVNTMVFTHLPSAVFRALIGVPNDVHWSLLFLLLGASTQSMDTAPRSAFLAMIIRPEERTAVMGTVNVIKTIAQSLGPLLTGILADRNLLWVAFVCCGGLKASYDIGLLALFKNKEKEKEEAERRKILQEESEPETDGSR